MATNRTVQGKVLSKVCYATQTLYLASTGKYASSNRFKFAAFIRGLENCKVRLTLEVLQ